MKDDVANVELSVVGIELYQAASIEHNIRKCYNCHEARNDSADLSIYTCDAIGRSFVAQKLTKKKKKISTT